MNKSFLPSKASTASLGLVVDDSIEAIPLVSVNMDD